MKRKHILLTLGFLLFAVAQSFAQSSEFRFIYIDHEATTPVNRLCDDIKQMREDQLESEYGDKVMIYLSTGLQSNNYHMLSLTNLKDLKGEGNDNDEAFNKIISALQSSVYHAVSAKNDVANIIKLFKDYRVINADYSLNHDHITIDFYVGKNFWLQEYNHKIIAHLFAAMQFDKLSSAVCDINIHYPSEAPISYFKDQPFGKYNLQNINNCKYVKMMRY